MLRRQVSIYLNGEISPADRPMSGSRRLLIAVDGGARHLRAIDILPDMLIGDLDSITEEDRAWCEAGDVEIRQYPAEKDDTDFELALRFALGRSNGMVHVYGGLGGRLDHTIANISVLAGPAQVGRQVELRRGEERVFFVGQHIQITSPSGTLLSLLPWGEPCTGISTSGLRYPLDEETLFPEHSRGVSNELLTGTAEIRCRKGNLLCIVHPSSY
jgi:thiamine pyrophosphokinase